MTFGGFSWIDPDGWQSRVFATREEAQDRAICCYRMRLEARRIRPSAAIAWEDLARNGWQIVEHAEALP